MSTFSYPYPVLGNADDVLNQIGIHPKTHVRYSPDEVSLSFRVQTDSADLIRMVQERKLQVVAKWTCSATMASGYLDLSDARSKRDGFRYETILDQEEVAGIVEVDVFVAAAEEIHDFYWENTNPEFGGFMWEVAPGDVLAYFGSFRFNVQKMFDPLNPPISSLLLIERNKDQKVDMVLNYDNGEQAVLHISDATADMLVNQEDSVKLAMVIFPALLQMICDVKRQLDDDVAVHELELPWQRVLWELVIRAGREDDEPMEIAQGLLTGTRGPVARALIDLEKLRD